jgi:hypothetical protein
MHGDLMALRDLSEADREIARQCVAAITRGGFIEDFEFGARLGVEREQIAQLLTAWPEIDDGGDDSDACLALNNCMNEICHGVPIAPREWARWFTVSAPEVRDAYRRWAQSRGWNATGVR